jgi:recombinational DNA repair protein RecT
MEAHGMKYSKTFKNGQWQNDFIGMGKKTALKLLVDKFAPKSVEIQKAITNDQGVFDSDGEMKYLDNGSNDPVDLEKYYGEQRSEIEKLLAIEGLMINEDEQLNIDRILDQNEVQSYKKVIVLLQSRKPKTKK